MNAHRPQYEQGIYHLVWSLYLFVLKHIRWKETVAYACMTQQVVWENFQPLGECELYSVSGEPPIGCCEIHRQRGGICIWFLIFSPQY